MNDQTLSDVDTQFLAEVFIGGRKVGEFDTRDESVGDPSEPLGELLVNGKKVGAFRLFDEADDDATKAVIYIGGKKLAELPILKDTIGDTIVLDASTLYQENNAIVYSPGSISACSCKSAITYIDGEKGLLLYRGFRIEDIAKDPFLNAALTLLNGDPPTKEEFEAFTASIGGKMSIEPRVLKMLKNYPHGAHPMAMLSSAVNALSAVGGPRGRAEIAQNFLDGIPSVIRLGLDDLRHSPEGLSKKNVLKRMWREARELCHPVPPPKPTTYNEIAEDILAKMPSLVAAAIRVSRYEKNGCKGKLTFIKPDPKLGYTENFLRMCFAKSNSENYVPNPVVVEVLDRIFTLHADHEQNASTDGVRKSASTGANPYAVLSTGINALSGALHGGANEAVMAMLKEIGGPENVPAFIERIVNPPPEGGKKERLMGFGHRVYKTYDPRAKLIAEDCERIFQALGIDKEEDNEKIRLLKTARELEKAALGNEYFKKKKLYPNVDFYSGIIFSAIGFSPEEFTPLFALARMSGWCAQWKEREERHKTPIERPHQNYIGEEERDYVPLETRCSDSPSPKAVNPAIYSGCGTGVPCVS